jgi:hypothetical protein
MNYYILTILILLILSFYSIYLRKNQIENFTVTWTPYVVDRYNQPGYSNYFYHNNYMYPVF